MEDLDGKRWIVLVEKQGGKEGEMEEWDLVEEFFNRKRRRKMRMRTRSEGWESVFSFVFSFVIHDLPISFFLLGLPLGLKESGPWAHHTEEVGMRY